MEDPREQIALTRAEKHDKKITQGFKNTVKKLENLKPQNEEEFTDYFANYFVKQHVSVYDRICHFIFPYPDIEQFHDKPSRFVLGGKEAIHKIQSKAQEVIYENIQIEDLESLDVLDEEQRKNLIHHRKESAKCSFELRKLLHENDPEGKIRDFFQSDSYAKQTHKAWIEDQGKEFQNDLSYGDFDKWAKAQGYADSKEYLEKNNGRYPGYCDIIY